MPEAHVSEAHTSVAHTQEAHIPETHPRRESLLVRERLVRGFDCGLVAREGLLAHGRGEAFDYLLGEETTPEARDAIDAAAAQLLLAARPVISINGNVAALCPGEMVELARCAGARLEVNLFYGGAGRVQKIAGVLYGCGAERVLGTDAGSSRRLPGTDSARRIVDADGIYSADTVLVPLEDGDRTLALRRAGKQVITFDLNPLSRTAQAADISIIDNITRGAGQLVHRCREMATREKNMLEGIVAGFDNNVNLSRCVARIRSGVGQCAGR